MLVFFFRKNVPKIKTASSVASIDRNSTPSADRITSVSSGRGADCLRRGSSRSSIGRPSGEVGRSLGELGGASFGESRVSMPSSALGGLRRGGGAKEEVGRATRDAGWGTSTVRGFWPVGVRNGWRRLTYSMKRRYLVFFDCPFSARNLR